MRARGAARGSAALACAVGRGEGIGRTGLRRGPRRRGWFGRASQRAHLDTIRSVGRQHRAVAMAVQARWGNQRGQPVEQFQRREAKRSAPIEPRLGQAIDELNKEQCLVVE